MVSAQCMNALRNTQSILCSIIRWRKDKLDWTYRQTDVIHTPDGSSIQKPPTNLNTSWKRNEDMKSKQNCLFWPYKKSTISLKKNLERLVDLRTSHICKDFKLKNYFNYDNSLMTRFLSNLTTWQLLTTKTLVSHPIKYEADYNFQQLLFIWHNGFYVMCSWCDKVANV